MVERRVRKGIGTARKAVPEAFRVAIKQSLDEAFAHLGVEPRQHSMDHEAFGRLLPELEKVVIPWAKTQQALDKRRQEWFDSVRAELTKDAARLITAFLLLSLFYGGAKALFHMINGG